MSHWCPSAYAEADAVTTIDGVRIDVRTGEVVDARQAARLTTVGEARAAAALVDAQTPGPDTDDFPLY